MEDCRIPTLKEQTLSLMVAIRWSLIQEQDSLVSGSGSLEQRHLILSIFIWIKNSLKNSKMVRLAILIVAALVIVYYATLVLHMCGFIKMTDRLGVRFRWLFPFGLWLSK
jgi:hypothetical protein